MKTYFPPLSLTKETLQMLRLAQRLTFERGPEFLEDPECPYTPEIKVFLRGQPGPAEAIDAEQVAIEAPEVEAETLLKFLKKLEKSLDEPNDKLAYARACTTLLEKIVSVKERSMTLKRQKDFEEAVIVTMENFLSPAQRTQFQERLSNVGL